MGKALLSECELQGQERWEHWHLIKQSNGRWRKTLSFVSRTSELKNVLLIVASVVSGSSLIPSWWTHSMSKMGFRTVVDTDENVKDPREMYLERVEVLNVGRVKIDQCNRQVEREMWGHESRGLEKPFWLYLMSLIWRRGGRRLFWVDLLTRGRFVPIDWNAEKFFESVEEVMWLMLRSGEKQSSEWSRTKIVVSMWKERKRSLDGWNNSVWHQSSLRKICLRVCSFSLRRLISKRWRKRRSRVTSMVCCVDVRCRTVDEQWVFPFPLCGRWMCLSRVCCNALFPPARWVWWFLNTCCCCFLFFPVDSVVSNESIVKACLFIFLVVKVRRRRTMNRRMKEKRREVSFECVQFVVCSRTKWSTQSLTLFLPMGCYRSNLLKV